MFAIFPSQLTTMDSTLAVNVVYRKKLDMLFATTDAQRTAIGSKNLLFKYSLPFLRIAIESGPIIFGVFTMVCLVHVSPIVRLMIRLGDCRVFMRHNGIIIAPCSI